MQSDKGPFKNVTSEGREGDQQNFKKTVTSIVSDCKFYCFHGDRGGREVWKLSFLRWPTTPLYLTEWVGKLSGPIFICVKKNSAKNFPWIFAPLLFSRLIFRASNFRASRNYIFRSPLIFPDIIWRLFLAVYHGKQCTMEIGLMFILRYP